MHFKALTKVFYIITWFNRETPYNKNHGLQKKKPKKNSFFTVDYVKIIELHIV